MTPLDFSAQAQQMLAFARKEAARLYHNFVGTEHLLLGLIHLGQGKGFSILKRLNIDPEAVRSEIKKQVGGGPEQKVIGNIPYTPRLKKVLALASKEATAMNHSYVGTEHILLGLLMEGDGVAARVLKAMNVETDALRGEILSDASAEDPGTKPDLASRESLEESLTPRAQQVLALARKEAEQFNHALVEPEHLLLGLIRLGTGVAVNVLLKLGLDLQTVRGEVQRQAGRAEAHQTAVSLQFTWPVSRVLAVARQEAEAFKHTYIGTEHLLLGLLQEDVGVCAAVFKNLKVDVGKTRREIVRELDPNAS